MFSDSFKLKVQESGKPCTEFKTDAFFASDKKTRDPQTSFATAQLPPRLLSDQMINNFFQEWAPLFPVLQSKPTLEHWVQQGVMPSQRIFLLRHLSQACAILLCALVPTLMTFMGKMPGMIVVHPDIRLISGGNQDRILWSC